MNILEAYLIQKGKLTVVFSSPDENLLKEIIYNLLKDFGAEMLNLYPYLKDMDNIDNRLVEKLFKIENKVIFIIGPAFPTNYIKGLKFNYHININLNKSLSKERNVDFNVFKISNEYNSIKYSFKNNKNNEVRSSINKTFNLAKFSNIKSLEDEIFNELIEMIKKKLDGGKYLSKLQIGEKKDENDLDKEILEEVDLNTYKTDDEIMGEVNFETADSYIIIGGTRKLNK